KSDSRIRKFDRHHRIQTAQLPFERSALVFLIFRQLTELLCGVRSSLLQFFRRREKASVFCCLPLSYLVVRDNGYASRRQDLIAARVIEMVVSINRLFDGLVC